LGCDPESDVDPEVPELGGGVVVGFGFELAVVGFAFEPEFGFAVGPDVALSFVNL